MNLYLDLGATHIKILYNGTVHIYEYLTKEKVNVKHFSEFVKNILSFYTFTRLYVCSQMHGFYIEGEPDYVSWMCEDVEPDNHDLTNTGLLPHYGLPCFNSKKYTFGGRMGGLVNTLLDEDYHISHETLECGTGFYDMIHKIQLPSRFQLPWVVKHGPIPCGTIGDAKVFAPLGDLQCAVMGIDQNLLLGDVVINMGTGSQIIQIGSTYREDTENRPLFDFTLNCITHIPSGRSLKFYKDLLDLPDYTELEFTDIIKSKERINLGYFRGSYGYDGSASITRIKEKTSKYTLACSLIRCYVKQYVKILSDKFRERRRIFLTGGIPNNIPVIEALFDYYLQDAVIVENNDTLKGLHKYSKYDDTRFWFNR